MKPAPVMFAVLFPAICTCHPDVAAGERLSSQDLRAAFGGATSPRKAGLALRDFFKAMTPADLAAAMDDPNTTIALHAAWLQSNRFRGGQAKPRPQRFLGFLEGRCGIMIPVQWEAALIYRSFDGKELRLVESALEDYLIPAIEKRENTEVGVQTEVNTKLKLDGDEVLVQQGTRSVRLSRQLFEKAMSKKPSKALCTVHVGPKRSFVAFHDVRANPFHLLCAETESGQVLWQADVWGLGKYFGGSGAKQHVVTIVPGDKKVLIFGFSFAECYLEGFDEQTGASLFRFSTEYWRCGG